MTSASPVDLEMDRLLAIIRAAWTPGHYSPTCGCTTCESTRIALSVADLAFIDSVYYAFAPQLLGASGVTS